MKRVPEFKTDAQAEAFLEQDLSNLDFKQFKPMRFGLVSGSGKSLRIRTPRRAKAFDPLQKHRGFSKAKASGMGRVASGLHMCGVAGEKVEGDGAIVVRATPCRACGKLARCYFFRSC